MVRRQSPGIAAVAILTILLGACGTPTESLTPTATSAPTRIPPTASTAPSPAPTVIAATPALTASPATPASAPVAATRTKLPDRAPDMTTGTRSDGWILDGIAASDIGGRVSLTLRFAPLPGQTGGPQADAWFDAGDATYSIAVRGVRGANVVLRPGEVMPLTAAPLRGYYALPVRDDTIFALVVVASRASAAWTVTAADTPGPPRVTLETR